MTLRKSPVVILSEAKNLNSLRTHRELLENPVSFKLRLRLGSPPCTILGSGPVWSKVRGLCEVFKTPAGRQEQRNRITKRASYPYPIN